MVLQKITWLLVGSDIGVGEGRGCCYDVRTLIIQAVHTQPMAQSLRQLSL